MATTDWERGDGTKFAGTVVRSEIDDEISQYIQTPIDYMMGKYRRGTLVEYGSASTVTISAGELAAVNSAGNLRMRKNVGSKTVDITVSGVGGLDTGSENPSTYYYVYAVAQDSPGTDGEFAVVCSVDSSSPTGFTYYRKIGWFYNDNNGDINLHGIGNIVQGDARNTFIAKGTTDINTTGSYSDILWDNAGGAGTAGTLNFVTSGRQVRFTYTATCTGARNWEGGRWKLLVDGADQQIIRAGTNDGSYPLWLPVVLNYQMTLSAGTHTCQMQWYNSDGTTYDYAATQSTDRIFIVEEL